jgi:hypothetical protein
MSRTFTIAVLWYVVVFNTVAILFGLYGYGSAKGWWR